MHGAPSGLFRDGCQQQPLGLGHERLLLGQQIHGEHQRQQKIHQRAQDGCGDVNGSIHHIVAVVGEEIRNDLGGVIHIHGKLRQGDAMPCSKGNDPAPPFLDLRYINGHVGHQCAAGLLQPGDEDKDNREDNAKKQQHSQHKADGPLQLYPPQLRCLFKGLVPQALNDLEQQVHNIGNADAQQQGGEQRKEAVQHPAQSGQIVQPPVQYDTAGNQQQNALAVFFVQLQGDPAFLD